MSILKVNGGSLMTKLNFKEMNLKELRKYILAHRDDDEAWSEYAARPRNSTLFPPSQSFDQYKEVIEKLLQKKESSQ